MEKGGGWPKKGGEEGKIINTKNLKIPTYLSTPPKPSEPTILYTENCLKWA